MFLYFSVIGGACWDEEFQDNNNNNIAIWSGMTNAVLQVSGPL